jgi:hypothetical protein
VQGRSSLHFVSNTLGINKLFRNGLQTLEFIEDEKNS